MGLPVDANGSTPLDPDEAEGLIPTHITTRDQLNVWEQANVLDGESWALRSRTADICTLNFAKRLHRAMFGETWRWAGQFRHTDKTIGIHWAQIPTAIHGLCADLATWIQHKVYGADEIAVRFHHRLVAIHPFPNGNGRHARLMTDLLLLRLKRSRFSWGASDLTARPPARDRYIAALRRADNGDVRPLLEFVRS